MPSSKARSCAEYICVVLMLLVLVCHLLLRGTYEADVFLYMHDLIMCLYIYMCYFADDKVILFEQRRDRVRFMICFVFDF